jgi:hypothetical protein
MDYTICSRVVALAAERPKYAFELLMLFIMDYGHNVVINTPILAEYSTFAQQNEIIRTWIKGMDYKESWKNVNVEEFSNLFIDTCRLTHDKLLIVCEKEDYNAEQYTGLQVLNKDEAIVHLKPTGVVINQIGNRNQASTGTKSSNTQ